MPNHLFLWICYNGRNRDYFQMHKQWAPLSSVHLSSLYESVLVRIFQVFQMPLSMINSFHFAEYEYFFFLVGEFGKTYLLLWRLSLFALPLQEASNMASNRFCRGTSLGGIVNRSGISSLQLGVRVWESKARDDDVNKFHF